MKRLVVPFFIVSLFVTTVVTKSDAAKISLYLPVVSGGGKPSNLSFEDGIGDGLQPHWIDGEGPFYDSFIEIRNPLVWGVAWYESDKGPGCKATPAYDLGRPEVSTISVLEDPVRVSAGRYAAKAFTFYRCHQMALFQQVYLACGKWQVSAMLHSWYSACDDPYKPYPEYRPYARCVEQYFAHDILQVCIDPSGGVDPWADTVQCGPEFEQYGGYGARVFSPIVELCGKATIFLRAESDHPDKHNDYYVDDVQVLSVE